MWGKLIELVAKIQKSDKYTKKRWVIGASALCMTLVIILWLSYINLTIKPVSGTSDLNSGDGLLATLSNGLKVVINGAEDQIKNLISEITNGRSITIEK